MMELMESKDTVKILVEQAQQGDRASFEELTDRYGARLRKLVEFRLGDSLRRAVEVDDVLQESFLRALQTIDRFE